MNLQNMAVITIALCVMLVGCDAEVPHENQDSTPVEVPEQVAIMLTPTPTPTPIQEVHVELDPKWKEDVQKMNERKVIATAHAYMNYLWCDDNGLEIKGDTKEIFQVLQDRWNSFDFDQTNSVQNKEKKLEDTVNESFDLAKTEEYMNDNKDAHRIMHHLDYFILEISKSDTYVYPYPYSTPFWNGQLKDWRK